MLDLVTSLLLHKNVGLMKQRMCARGDSSFDNTQSCLPGVPWSSSSSPAASMQLLDPHILILLKSLHYDIVELEKKTFPSCCVQHHHHFTFLLTPFNESPLSSIYTPAAPTKIMENDFECDCHCKTGTPFLYSNQQL